MYEGSSISASLREAVKHALFIRGLPEVIKASIHTSYGWDTTPNQHNCWVGARGKPTARTCPELVRNWYHAWYVTASLHLIDLEHRVIAWCPQKSVATCFRIHHFRSGDEVAHACLVQHHRISGPSLIKKLCGTFSKYIVRIVTTVLAKRRLLLSQLNTLKGKRCVSGLEENLQLGCGVHP